MEHRDDLVLAFSELEESMIARSASLPRPPAVNLRLIRILNLEMGRAADASPAAAPWMRKLQKRVNDVTVALKAGRMSDARESLEAARAVLEGFLGPR